MKTLTFLLLLISQIALAQKTDFTNCVEIADEFAITQSTILNYSASFYMSNTTLVEDALTLAASDYLVSGQYSKKAISEEMKPSPMYKYCLKMYLKQIKDIFTDLVAISS
jgi:hypothetical protein